jgi:hypothetical protein
MNDFDDIRMRLDPLSVAEGLGLRARSGYFVCPEASCPSHKHSRVTCKTYNDGFWKCHACDMKGDSVELIHIVNNVTKAEAFKAAKEMAGVSDSAPKERAIMTRVDDRYRALTLATAHYESIRIRGADYLDELGLGGDDFNRCVKNLKVCRDYLKGRGIAPIAQLPVPTGLVPHFRTGLDLALGDLNDMAMAVGLVNDKGSERYGGMVYLPWVDESGRTVAAKGRAIPAFNRKIPMTFQSTGDSETNHVPKPPVPYGWNASHDADKILVVEGEIDALTAIIAGYPAVAMGGTSGDGFEAVKSKVKRDRGVVLFDGDAPGRIGAAKIGKAAGLWWCHLQGEDDLNDTLQSRGSEGVRKEIELALAHVSEPQTAPKAEVKAEVGTVPDGWVIKDSKLYTTKEFGDEDDWEFTGIRNPPEITWRGRDVNDGTVVVGIRAKVAGSEQYADISVKRQNLKTGREIVAALSGHGIDVDATTARHMIKFLGDMEYHVADLVPFAQGSRQLGWVKGSFLYGSDCIGMDEVNFIGDETKKIESLSPKGDFDKWKAGVLEPLQKFPKALAGMCGGLAAPIIKHIPDLTGFVIEYADDSSFGKSTVSSSVASIFGRPSEDSGIMMPPSSTDASLYIYASLMQNFPLFLEDSHLMAPKERLRDIVMAWSNGLPKARATKGGESLQQAQQWATVSIITGEASILRSTHYGGVGARTISLSSPLPRFPVGDPQDVEMRRMIKGVNSTKSANYGLAGRAWVEWLVDGGVDKVKDAFEEISVVTNDMIDLGGPQARWANFFALMAACARFAPKIIGMRPDAEKVMLDLAEDYFATRSVPDPAADSLQMVLSWVGQDQWGGIDGTSAKPTDRHSNVWFRIYDDGTVAVSVQYLKTRLEREGIYLDQCLKTWYERGWLRHKGSQRQTIRATLARGRVPCVPIDPNALGEFGIEAKKKIPEERMFDA